MRSKIMKIISLSIVLILMLVVFAMPVMAIDILDNAPGTPEIQMAGTNVRGVISSILMLASFIIVITAVVKFIITMKNIKKSQSSDEIKDKEKKKARRRLSNWIGVFIIGAMISSVLSMIQNFAKPIIYLYPKKKQKVTVKVKREDKLTCTYPKYNDSWEVMAEPTGELVDIKTGRNLYGLYYEANKMQPSKTEEGFCVKGEDTAKFLEEKLAILGLSEREANEFIIYWLPKLEKNKYNLIRFEETELINENMPIEITPNPDTFIRIIMEYKPLNKYIELKEQKLVTPTRERICCR